MKSLDSIIYLGKDKVRFSYLENDILFGVQEFDGIHNIIALNLTNNTPDDHISVSRFQYDYMTRKINYIGWPSVFKWFQNHDVNQSINLCYGWTDIELMDGKLRWNGDPYYLSQPTMFKNGYEWNKAKKLYQIIEDHYDEWKSKKIDDMKISSDAKSILNSIAESQVSAKDLMQGIKERFPNFNQSEHKIILNTTKGYSIYKNDEHFTVEQLIRELDKLAE